MKQTYTVTIVSDAGRGVAFQVTTDTLTTFQRAFERMAQGMLGGVKPKAEAPNAKNS